MKMKKTIASLLALVLVAGLAGCGSSNQKGGDNSGQVDLDEPFDLTIMTLYADERTKVLHDKATEKMKELMPNVNVTLEIDPNDDNVKIKTMAAAGTMPDVYRGSTDLINLLHEYDASYPIDAQYEKYKDRLQEVYQPYMVNADGHVYAISEALTSVMLMYYNKTVFNNLGLEVPKNYEEFLHVIDVCVENGIIPLSMANETWSHAMLYEVFATAEGVSLQSLDKGTDSMVENPAYRTVAERVQECLKHGLISDSAFTNDFTTSNQLLYQGKAAMAFQDSVPISEHYNNMGDTFGWIPYSAFYPADKVTDDSDYIVAGGPMPDDGPAVSAQSKNPALAAEWAVQYTLEKMNVSYELGYSPQTTTDKLEVEVEPNPVMSAYMEFFPKIKSFTTFPWGYSNPDSYVITGEQCSKFLTGDYDIDSFLTETQKLMDEAREG